jgi:hypothetical protein
MIFFRDIFELDSADELLALLALPVSEVFRLRLRPEVSFEIERGLAFI